MVMRLCTRTGNKKQRRGSSGDMESCMADSVERAMARAETALRRTGIGATKQEKEKLAALLREVAEGLRSAMGDCRNAHQRSQVSVLITDVSSVLYKIETPGMLY